MKYKLFLYGGYSWFCMLLMCLSVAFFIDYPSYGQFAVIIVCLGCSLFTAWCADSEWKKHLKPPKKKVVVGKKHTGQVRFHLGEFDTDEESREFGKKLEAIVRSALAAEGYNFGGTYITQEITEVPV